MMFLHHFFLLILAGGSSAFLLQTTTTSGSVQSVAKAFPRVVRPSRWEPCMVSSSSSAESTSRKVSSSSSSSSKGVRVTVSSSECDDFNVPPSLSLIMRSLTSLASGSDIRGRFVDHKRLGSIVHAANAIGKNDMGVPPLTPLAAHCLGYAFATMVLEESASLRSGDKGDEEEDVPVIITIGQDPRLHGSILADAFGRGAQGVRNIRVKYTGIATTPAMFDFCRSSLCDGGVMVTASHLPSDRNGFKFFTLDGGFTKAKIQRLLSLAREHVQVWYDLGIMPPTSGPGAVFCSEWVDFMPKYESNLKRALMEQVLGVAGADAAETGSDSDKKQTLSGLKIVVNAGNGSGGFFQKVLRDLGADVSASIHIAPDGDFPAGYIPNPEDEPMVEETTRACEAANADIGVLFDTDADRCGFVVPRTIRADGTYADYEPLNRNRLIALLGVLFSTTSPGCAIVTDSVTSNGLSTFLTEDLGLVHVRYLKGYANVISKARELTEETIVNAEVAIETSGHCAMRENDYLDDGTYTACKVIGLLAKEKSNQGRSLLDLIENLQEMEEVAELRMQVKDESLESMRELFDIAALQIELECEPLASTTTSKNDDESEMKKDNGPTSNWILDRENLEGIRVSTGNGGFFMLRKSLHDPVMSLQVEATSKDEARKVVIDPLLRLLESLENIQSNLNMENLYGY